jgi:hypothetical protein
MRMNSKLNRAVKESKKEEVDDGKSLLIQAELEKIFDPCVQENMQKDEPVVKPSESFSRANVMRVGLGVNRLPPTM